MNIGGAIVAGVIGTFAMSLLMLVGPRMGMPKMAIWEMLGSMMDADGNNSLGWILHFMMGSIFALIYAALWNAGIGSVSAGGGLAFGAVHFLLAGTAMSMVPVMHAGIKAGKAKAPGFLMLNSGMMGLVGGLSGHLAFGLVVALGYALF